MDVLLASASPRRRELLRAILDRFSVHAANIPEPLTGDAEQDAISLARAKAAVVANQAPNALVIGADTIVYDALRCYGKPENDDDARATLARLQGRWHSVVTGIALRIGTRLHSDLSQSRVRMHSLTYSEINRYIESGRPLDKAGAYAIQDSDVPTVDELDGCYCAVMGLPLWRLQRALTAFGVEAQRPDTCYARCAACPDAPTESS